MLVFSDAAKLEDQIAAARDSIKRNGGQCGISEVTQAEACGAGNLTRAEMAAMFATVSYYSRTGANVGSITNAPTSKLTYVDWMVLPAYIGADAAATAIGEQTLYSKSVDSNRSMFVLDAKASVVSQDFLTGASLQGAMNYNLEWDNGNGVRLLPLASIIDVPASAAATGQGVVPASASCCTEIGDFQNPGFLANPNDQLKISLRPIEGAANPTVVAGEQIIITLRMLVNDSH